MKGFGLRRWTSIPTGNMRIAYRHTGSGQRLTTTKSSFFVVHTLVAAGVNPVTDPHRRRRHRRASSAGSPRLRRQTIPTAVAAHTASPSRHHADRHRHIIAVSTTNDVGSNLESSSYRTYAASIATSARLLWAHPRRCGGSSIIRQSSPFSSSGPILNPHRRRSPSTNGCGTYHLDDIYTSSGGFHPYITDDSSSGADRDPPRSRHIAINAIGIFVVVQSSNVGRSIRPAIRTTRPSSSPYRPRRSTQRLRSSSSSSGIHIFPDAIKPLPYLARRASPKTLKPDPPITAPDASRILVISASSSIIAPPRTIFNHLIGSGSSEWYQHHTSCRSSFMDPPRRTSGSSSISSIHIARRHIILTSTFVIVLALRRQSSSSDSSIFDIYSSKVVTNHRSSTGTDSYYRHPHQLSASFRIE